MTRHWMRAGRRRAQHSANWTGRRRMQVGHCRAVQLRHFEACLLIPCLRWDLSW